MAKTFTASLAGLCDQAKGNMRHIMRESVQDVLEAAQTPQPKAAIRGGPPEQGKIPVDTSELINSLTVDGAQGADAYVVKIAGMELGDVMEFAWTADHAARIEYGFVGTDSLGREYEQEGAHFVGANAARFSEFVEKRAAEVKK
ncbi:hypothetical protein PARHAE_02059 [Paracoccus haematequi]|uniref:HK97 gp10 family phage protein n=1 Tax=Paracoccus haematequi TaxID=2491866 RepID=A0A3S5D422_9RHOB|nr:hypothetical protein [Paracoccus haematequi]VDS08874.1 hypothetical protein PARHAE_02059 [Paracoccus haematequi]